MAFSVQNTCMCCGKVYNYIQSARSVSDDICQVCKSKEADALKIQHFDKLDSLTIEQRLRRLEKVQYNNSLISNGLQNNQNDFYG